MSCTNCPASQYRYKEIQTVGTGECELLIVGDYPKDIDNMSGYPFTGSEYKFIWDLLAQVGVSYYVTYLMKCVPVDPATRRLVKPTREYYSTCYQSRFVKEVEELKPKCILAFGQNSLEMLLDVPAKVADYSNRPTKITIGSHETKVIGTYSPTYILMNENDVVTNRFFDTIVTSCRHAMSDRPENKELKTITLTPDQFVRVSDIWVNDPSIEYVSFDTESNGLNPLVPGAKITSFSMCVDGKIGYNVFLYHPELTISDEDREKVVSAAKKILLCKKIIAHHAKHEHRFVKVLWGFTPNIVEDTMYMSYTLYLSYFGMTHGLKHLSGRFAGMPPWEEVIEQYGELFKDLKRNKSLDDTKIQNFISKYPEIGVTSEDINRFFSIIKDPDYYIKQSDSEESDIYMWLIPERILAQYAGMDAIAPLRLMKVFKPKIESDPGLTKAYSLLVKGAETFANVELHGVRLYDREMWTKVYEQKLESCMEVLRTFSEVVDYEISSQSEYNPNSSTQNKEVFYTKFRFPVLGTTGKGEPSTSEPTLIELIKHYRDKEDPESKRRTEFLTTFREYKKLGKIMSGYLVGLRKFIRDNDMFDGHTCEYLKPKSPGELYECMHPGYLLHGTDCVVAGTLVQTDKGEIPIEDLTDQVLYDRGFYKMKEGIKVFDGDIYREPKFFYYGGIRETLRIHTLDGGHIRCTPEHPLYVDEAGWVMSKNLKVGDMLVRYRDISQTNVEYSLYNSPIIHICPDNEVPVYDLTMEDDGCVFTP